MSGKRSSKKLAIEANVPKWLDDAIDQQHRLIRNREPTLEELLPNLGMTDLMHDYGRQLQAVNAMLAEGITRWRAAFLATSAAEKLRVILGDTADLTIFSQATRDGELRLVLNGLVTGSDRPRFRLIKREQDIDINSLLIYSADDLAGNAPHSFLREALRFLLTDDGEGVWKLIHDEFTKKTWGGR